MKASELAALLMQNPDAEVYIENAETPEFHDWYYSTDKITGIQITPSGVFLNHEYLAHEESEKIKSPHNKPVLDSIDVYLNSGLLETYPASQGYDDLIHGEVFFQDMANTGCVYGYLDGCSMNFTEEEVQDQYMTEAYYTIDDVKHISVLTSIDEKWDPHYTEMSYAEAKKYFVEKYNIVKEEE